MRRALLWATLLTLGTVPGARPLRTYSKLSRDSFLELVCPLGLGRAVQGCAGVSQWRRARADRLKQIVMKKAAAMRYNEGWIRMYKRMKKSAHARYF